MRKKRSPGNRLKNRLKKGNPTIAELGKNTRFQPGQSGNPSGRPRDLLTEEIRLLILKRKPNPISR